VPHGSIGTIRARSHLTFGLPLRQACGCSVGGQLKPYYLDHPSPFYSPTTMSSQHQSSSPNLVGGHYRVGRKIGEGSFGVIFEGLFFFSLSPRPFLQPEPVFLTQGRTFSTPRPLPSNLSVYICLGAVHRPDPIPIQEPRKAEAPQLRDECRSYRILAGCRQCNAVFH